MLLCVSVIVRVNESKGNGNLAAMRGVRDVQRGEPVRAGGVPVRAHRNAPEGLPPRHQRRRVRPSMHYSLSGAEVYYTACSVLVMLMNPCGKLHCQRGFDLAFFSCKKVAFTFSLGACPCMRIQIAIPPLSCFWTPGDSWRAPPMLRFAPTFEYPPRPWLSSHSSVSEHESDPRSRQAWTMQGPSNLNPSQL